MRVKGNRIRNVLLWAVCLCLLGFPMGVKAQGAPYTSLTIDKDGYPVRTVDGYIPGGLWDKIGEEQLKKPSDLFISKEDEMYIADTGNRRILVCSLEGEYLREISQGLEEPAGVFVTEEGLVYVADTKAGKILVFDREGALVKEFGTPVSPLFGKSAKYAPTKLVVNRSGTIYALSEGNAEGILTISDYGDFYGYFGANETYMSLANRIRRALFTEEQLKSMQKSVPPSACNIDMDSTGLIYTVTQGSEGDGLKKFNMAGNNMFADIFVDTLVTDVAVGSIDNIFAVSKQGYIYEYTRDGELLFHFGGTDDGNNRMGLFTTAQAIEADSRNRLYVLDSGRGDITVFQPTEYADTVHQALALYQEGLYTESREPWERVLRQNGLFDYAYRGIAQAQYKLEDYGGAMEAARLGGAGDTYSSAFWQIRNRWLRDHIVAVFWILLGLVCLGKIWRRWGDRIPVIRRIRAGLRFLGRTRGVRELGFLRYVIKNPADAFYGIKHEGKVSVATATAVYLLFFLLFVAGKYGSGFLFKTVPDGQYDIGGDMVRTLGVMILFVVCNHMICSIRDGEATLKQNYCAFIYCFMPYLFLKPAAFALSHVLTYNESFLIGMLNFIMVAGTGILIYFCIKEIQCYTYRETFISIFLTLFTMLIVAAAGFILFALMRQVWDFAIGIYKEVYYRGR
ncbi:MAG: hypothetical protein HFH94_05300 [Lachnospiraceae bacterium]|jgi:tetratricopeptide (TPR) repeat protein|nr:YIP1 family protein [uncultured Acetatifactor sp.]MCI9219138.1 hypothetical protein [Lachnospiraceae bacterium]